MNHSQPLNAHRHSELKRWSPCHGSWRQIPVFLPCLVLGTGKDTETTDHSFPFPHISGRLIPGSQDSPYKKKNNSTKGIQRNCPFSGNRSSQIPPWQKSRYNTIIFCIIQKLGSALFGQTFPTATNAALSNSQVTAKNSGGKTTGLHTSSRSNLLHS